MHGGFLSPASAMWLPSQSRSFHPFEREPFSLVSFEEGLCGLLPTPWLQKKMCLMRAATRINPEDVYPENSRLNL